MAEILQEGHVFYNPVQEFNRDMSICVLATFIRRYKEDLAEKLAAKSNNKQKKKDQEAVNRTILLFVALFNFVYLILAISQRNSNTGSSVCNRLEKYSVCKGN